MWQLSGSLGSKLTTQPLLCLHPRKKKCVAEGLGVIQVRMVLRGDIPGCEEGGPRVAAIVWLGLQVCFGRLGVPLHK